ncbi:unnamed protein product, partial [Coccothraustes coccothraustes]
LWAQQRRGRAGFGGPLTGIGGWLPVAENGSLTLHQAAVASKAAPADGRKSPQPKPLKAAAALCSLVWQAILGWLFSFASCTDQEPNITDFRRTVSSLAEEPNQAEFTRVLLNRTERRRHRPNRRSSSEPRREQQNLTTIHEGGALAVTV